MTADGERLFDRLKAADIDDIRLAAQGLDAMINVEMPSLDGSVHTGAYWRSWQ